MSTIITFYSYKGGVGRSMALANIAVLMAERGLNVLAVDWDLEAPGLERYFSYFEQSTRAGGLLPFFSEAAEKFNTEELLPKYQDHIWEIFVNDKQSFSFIPSGRETHKAYAKMLENFSWKKFFSNGGGDFIEQLRNIWRSEYDFVLIDSRTGMSDTGGICTIQIPDVLVAMFTANEQSMLGVIDIIHAAQKNRQKLAYDRMPLTVLPIASRFSSYTEIQESSIWLDRFEKNFQGVCDDWLPVWVPLSVVFERLKIPQVDWFSFGERLAVVEQGTSDPTSMGYALDRITDILAADFRDLELAFGRVAQQPSDWSPPERTKITKDPKIDKDYEYDIFVSYRSGGVLNEWVQIFVDELVEWLSLELPNNPRVFLDMKSLVPGENWGKSLDDAMSRSKILLAIITPAYFASEFCTREWVFFATREKETGISPLILPVIVRGGSDTLPSKVLDRQMIDARSVVLTNLDQKASKKSYELLQESASYITNMIREVPPYDPNYITIDDADLIMLRPPETSKFTLASRSNKEIDEWMQPIPGFKPIPFGNNLVNAVTYPDVPVDFVKPRFGQDRIPFELNIKEPHRLIRGIEHKPRLYNDGEHSQEITPGACATAAYVLISSGNARRIVENIEFDNRLIGYLEFYFEDSSENDPYKIDLILGKNIRDWSYKHPDVVQKITDLTVEQVWTNSLDQITIDMLRITFPNPPVKIKYCKIYAHIPGLPSQYRETFPSIKISGLTYRTSD